jgi:diguanylate cyclase (GGDEF)-like protein/PAS domain S-box-containing protein
VVTVNGEGGTRSNVLGPALRRAADRLPRVRGRRIRLVDAYVGVSAILAIGYYFFPDHHLQLWTPLGLLAVAAMVTGIRIHRPRQPAAWYLLAAATCTFILGDTTYNVLTEVAGQVNPFPSLADPLYLLTYPLFAAGLWLLIRGRTTAPDRRGLLDASIITTAVALVVWMYLVLPNFQAPDLTTLERLVSVAYPLGDVLLLAMLARLVTGGGLGVRAIQLLVVGAVGIFASDVMYGFSQLQLAWSMGGFVDLGWILFYVTWGAAALHPSMSRVSDEPADNEIKSGRIAAIGAFSLIAPAVLLSDATFNDGDNAFIVAVFSACINVLILIRLAGTVSVHRQAVARERVLRACGESLVTAQGREEISSAGLAAVHALTNAAPWITTSLHLARVTAADGPETSGSVHDGVAELERFWTVAESGGGLCDGRRTSVTPLRYDRAVQGMLVVRGEQFLPVELHGTLTALAAQLALAMDSDRLAQDLRRRQNDEHFSSLIQNAADIILVVSADGELTSGLPSLQRALGLHAPPTGAELLALVHPEEAPRARQLVQGFRGGAVADQRTGDWRLLHADGMYRSFEIQLRDMLASPVVAGLVLTMRDVSQRRELETQLQHQAFHDGLTGLPNRALLQDRAAHALSRLDRTERCMAMLMVDLDNFKEINDTHGHGVGDAVLVAIANRLTLALRPGDTAARLGGDEFAVLVENVPDVATAEMMAARILSAFVAPVVIGDELLFVQASAGLVVNDAKDAIGLTELLLQADLALYAAKERGKGQYQRYTPDLRTAMRDRVTRRAELQRAVLQDEFALVYQPIVVIETGEVTGVEALLRWEHPRLGTVGPYDFIGLAEETGLIVPIGRWVLNTACAQAAVWERESAGRLRISVNVSGRQLQEPSFVADVRDALTVHGLPPRSLVLELTETILLGKGSDVAERLSQLKSLGVKIAIDDFGTGYSNLGYLQQFGIDILKVDKSFVDDLGKDRGDAGALAEAMVSMAHVLRLEVVAEGIERAEQRDELWTLGCGMGQGYFYARPLPAAQITDLVRGSGHLGGPSVLATHGALAQLRAPGSELNPSG